MFSSCAVPLSSSAKGVSLTKVTFHHLPGWEKDRHREVVEPLLHSCKAFPSKSSQAIYEKDKRFGNAGQWRDFCAKLQQTQPSDVRSFLEQNTTPYLVASKNGDAEGFFTGYYEIGLEGSWQKTDEYRYPLYRSPPDLASRKPYYTRKEINGGALKGKGLELLWLKSPIDRFFLHVQGSGRVVLPDGKNVGIGFAGKNGHEYVSIGRHLIDIGAIAKKDVTAESIRQWLATYPEQRQAVLEQNPSYIFFRELSGEGVIGAQGVALTAQRSLAIDRSWMPFGVPLWVDVFGLDQPIQKLMVTQDTGSAIKGAVRGDIFFGFGKHAETMASILQHHGHYYVLLPKEIE